MRIKIEHDPTCQIYDTYLKTIGIEKCNCGAAEGLTPLREYLHMTRDVYHTPVAMEIREKLLKWGDHGTK